MGIGVWCGGYGVSGLLWWVMDLCVYQEGLSAGIREWVVVVRLGVLMREEDEVWEWVGVGLGRGLRDSSEGEGVGAWRW